MNVRKDGLRPYQPQSPRLLAHNIHVRKYRYSAVNIKNMFYIVSNLQMPGEAHAQWHFQGRDWEALRENDTVSVLQNLHNTVMV